MSKTVDMEKIISLILRVGVIISMAVISAGLLLHIFLNLSGALLIIKIGLFILILTPFARLVVSLIMFLIEKDVVYFLITLAIIVIIVISNMIVSAK